MEPKMCDYYHIISERSQNSAYCYFKISSSTSLSLGHLLTITVFRLWDQGSGVNTRQLKQNSQSFLLLSASITPCTLTTQL